MTNAPIGYLYRQGQPEGMGKEDGAPDHIGRDGTPDDMHKALVRGLPGRAVPHPLEDHQAARDGDPADELDEVLDAFHRQGHLLAARTGIGQG